ncbi:glycoside hydrolase family 37 protein, partial [Lactarius hatsudake]
MIFAKWTIAGYAINVARAVPQVSTTTGVLTSVPPITLATSVASPTVPLTATLPSQVPLPPVQAWCPSEIFCAGALLQTVNVAELWSDPKTFVDKPTNSSSQSVLTAFAPINSTNTTEGAVLDFVDSNFRGEGLELEAQALPNFNANPPFLNNVVDPLLRAFSQIVHGYWTQLIRGTNSSTLCNGTTCESTIIPLNHTFVVPGGRFREQYYWDSFWIIEGLIQSQLFDIAKETLENFMDEIERFGFIPNGGRIYYLNRSQPPLFIWMLSTYVSASNDTAILDRALPLAERELKWWRDNRSVNITSPYTNKTYTLSRFSVTNSAPRPESYLTDYNTANDPTLSTPLTESQRAELYSELASGAESGWDYSTRFIALPHERRRRIFALAILDLFWDSSKLAFYDFNLTSNSRNNFFSGRYVLPLWADIIPTRSSPALQTRLAASRLSTWWLRRYNGTYPTTFIESGLQWDAPNAWPPHQYIALQALLGLPSNISSGAIPQPPTGQSAYALVPSGQLDVAENALPGQLVTNGRNASSTGSSADINALSGTFVNGGNTTANEGWRDALCAFLTTSGSFLLEYATGGLSIKNTATFMFEKFSIRDIDSGGRGGEYT